MTYYIINIMRDSRNTVSFLNKKWYERIYNNKGSKKEQQKKFT